MTDAYIIQQYLKDPNTSSEILDQIAMRKNTSRKVAVAQHPNVSEDTLAKLMRVKSYRLRCAVASHPKMNQAIATFLLHDVSIQHPPWGQVAVHITLAWNPNTPSETLSELLLHPKGIVRVNLAENPSLTQEQLAVLCQDEQWVRQNVVLHHSFLPWVSVHENSGVYNQTILLGYLP